MRLNHKKRWFTILKATIFVASWLFITYRLIEDDSFIKLYGQIGKQSIRLLYLLFAFLLMPFNWFFETQKWGILTRKFEKVSFRQLFLSVCSGISVAIFTPNRTGEYLGRVWVFSEKNRWQGVSSSIIGSIAQSGVTVFAGTIAGYTWLSTPDLNQLTSMENVAFAAFSVVIGLMVYLLLPWLSSIVLPRVKNKQANLFLQGIAGQDQKVLINVLLLSIVRYIVFVVQFVLLLYAFNAGLSIQEALLGIALIYSAMLLIPTITLTEPGVRGAVTIYIFGVFSSNTGGILSASLTLWIINLAIPALIGSGWLARFKYRDK